MHILQFSVHKPFVLYTDSCSSTTRKMSVVCFEKWQKIVKQRVYTLHTRARIRVIFLKYKKNFYFIFSYFLVSLFAFGCCFCFYSYSFFSFGCSVLILKNGTRHLANITAHNNIKVKRRWSNFRFCRHVYDMACLSELFMRCTCNIFNVIFMI